MASTLRPLPILTAAALFFYSGFSRFTHGAYTPGYDAFQIAHAPDDGGPLALITPCIDVVLGSALLWRRTRRGAAVFATVFCGIGLVQQMVQGKDFGGDLALAVLNLGAVWAAFSR
jgi:hypothetical protein